jgi:hypothetical protein
MYTNIKAIRDKLRLWENQLKLHNLVYFPHLKSLDTIFCFFLREAFDELDVINLFTVRY